MTNILINSLILETKAEIPTIESLQYDFATIKAATNDFSPANELGHGGFGAVYKVIILSLNVFMN